LFKPKHVALLTIKYCPNRSCDCRYRWLGGLKAWVCRRSLAGIPG